MEKKYILTENEISELICKGIVFERKFKKENPNCECVPCDIGDNVLIKFIKNYNNLK